MIINSKYVTFAGLPQDTIDKILEICKEKELENALIGDDPEAESSEQKNIRDVKIGWIDDQWLYDILDPYITAANEQAEWNFQLDTHEAVQYCEYTQGHHYSWHVDQTPVYYEKDHLCRKISMTVQLSDPSEYEGGDLELMSLEQGETEILELGSDAKKLGSIIVFPSFMTHRITPVTRGKRLSLVNWTSGKNWI